MPHDPLHVDIKCPRCGYNLRGLSGDPVRCPECGFKSERETLFAQVPTPRSRAEELLIRLRDQTFGLLLWLAVLVPLSIAMLFAAGPAPLLLILFLVGIPAFGIIVLGPAWEMARLGLGRAGWAWVIRYQAATVGLVLGLALVWLGFTLPAQWLLNQLGADGYRLLAAGLALLATVLLGVRLKPVSRLREYQEQQFTALVRLMADADTPGLQPSPATASLRGTMKHDSIQHLLASAFTAAIAEVTGQDPATVDPVLRPAGDPKFGDYQCNAAMPLAKSLKTKPRDVAERIKAAAEPRLGEMIEPLEVAGPGFLNIRLQNAYLGRYLAEIAPPPRGLEQDMADRAAFAPTSEAFDRVGMPPTDTPQRVVVEYSQPNIAKQMHVGHLRSTIIGDVIARVLMFEGHEVVRQNHIGDWGTQFGMLIRWYREHPLPTTATHDDVLEAIEQDYKTANERFKTDEQFATEARQAVGQLQGGDPDAYRLWQQICQVSLDAIDELYQRLGVLLRPEDVRGESYYNDDLPQVVAELRETLGDDRAGGRRAVVRDDQGAVCAFMYDEQGEPAYKGPEGDILPMIIQKSDGAYLYSTTDLAAIRYRLRRMGFPSGTGAQRVIYVTDARQKLHFDMWMACARAAGWITPDHQVEHVTFGSVLGTDRRPLKTREGGTVKLRELLDEAESRALALLQERVTESDEATERRSDEGASEQIARRVGVAAVKYADLRNDRNSDYVFTWDKMITFQGNTAPYMMYAYARIRSIYRKAAERFGAPDVYAADVQVQLVEPAERALALRLARLREAIDDVAANLAPHTLCGYLYDLAGDFMRFYESCPVLQAPDDTARLSRMRLCDLTARTLRLGLGLLGIEVIERM